MRRRRSASRVETEPWAKTEYERLLKEEGGLGRTFRNLFKYAAMGDRKAGEAERDYLLKIIGTHPSQYENLDQDGRHYDCYLDAVRFDAVYDLLTPEQVKKIEETFRAYIAFQLEDKKLYTRTSWLPNMQWPRPIAAHLMAVGSKTKSSSERSSPATAVGSGISMTTSPTDTFMAKSLPSTVR